MANLMLYLWPKPKAYCWGGIMKVFSHDIEDDANEVEIDFQKKFVNSSDPSLIKWDWPPVEDKEVVDAKLLIARPMIPEVSHASHKKSYIQFKEEPVIFKKIECHCQTQIARSLRINLLSYLDRF